MARCYACDNLHIAENMYLDYYAIPFLIFLHFDCLSGSSLISDGSYISDNNYLISVGVKQWLVSDGLTFEIQPL